MPSADLSLGQALLVSVRERGIGLTALGTDPRLLAHSILTSTGSSRERAVSYSYLTVLLIGML